MLNLCFFPQIPFLLFVFTLFPVPSYPSFPTSLPSFLLPSLLLAPFFLFLSFLFPLLLFFLFPYLSFLPDLPPSFISFPLLSSSPPSCSLLPHTYLPLLHPFILLLPFLLLFSLSSPPPHFSLPSFCSSSIPPFLSHSLLHLSSVLLLLCLLTSSLFSFLLSSSSLSSVQTTAGPQPWLKHGQR